MRSTIWVKIVFLLPVFFLLITNEISGDNRKSPNLSSSTQIGPWVTTTSFFIAREAHSSIAYNGYLYIIGGSDGENDIDDIQFSKINPNGTLGTWKTLNPLLYARSNHTCFIHKDKLYVVGCWEPRIEVAAIKPNGTLGDWEAIPGLPNGRLCHTMHIYNDHVYIIGGFIDSVQTALNDALVAQINEDGTLSKFKKTKSFPGSRYDHSGVLYNGYIYIIGGNNGENFLKDVQYTSINSDGSLNGWQYTASLPEERTGHAAVAYDGHIYVTGGNNDTLIYAKINDDGTLESWTTSPNKFQNNREQHTSIIYNERIYITGGKSQPDFYNDVQFSLIKSQAGNPKISLNRNSLHFGARSEIESPDQEFSIDNSGSGSLNWSVIFDQSWLSCSPVSGTGPGTVSVSINSSGLSAGTYKGSITVSDPNASNSPQTVLVTLKVFGPGSTSVPFGVFSTPIHNSTVKSSIPVTGWVLDDIGVESLRIYRGSGNDLVYIGDGVFVDGARPDVEQAYPGYPNNYRAGWGYMLLTNFLPNGGNGTYILYAKAIDLEGNEVTLGSKIITADNTNAVKPFGAIDTPTQGGTASGSSFVNWGWVLTPQPNRIPTDGSTVDVWVDGINLGNPKYNIYREDIAVLFAGYANSGGAVGYFSIDTTNYQNGVHTIQWTAIDSGGNKDGIGSRYFTIQNTGGSSDHQEHSQSFRFNSLQISDIPIEYNSPVKFRRGFDKNNDIALIHQDDKGTSLLKIRELERIEIQLIKDEGFVSGYLLSGSQLRPLPIGSTLKNGIFSWIPGPGFLGDYVLLFAVKGPDGALSKREFIVRIEPKFGVNK